MAIEAKNPNALQARCVTLYSIEYFALSSVFLSIFLFCILLPKDYLFLV